jgi:hypothetical protein
VALPVTISGTLPPTDFNAGGLLPVISSGGNVYVILLDSTDTSLLEAWKATDPETSFAEQDSADKPNLTNIILAASVVQEGDVIHIATQEDSTGRVGYHTFNMATDQWVVVNEQITATTFIGQQYHVGISVRSDGDVIVAYVGLRETITMSDLQRVKYARREGGSWTADVAVDDGGSVNWVSPEVVIGSSDRMHIFFVHDENDDGYQRCLRSDNSLETFPAAFETTVGITASRQDFGRGVSYDSGGTIKVRCPYVGVSTRPYMASLDSADTPTVTGAEISTHAVLVNGVAGQDCYQLASVAKGTDLYTLWINNADSDLYRDVNADGGGWGTDTNTFTGTVTWLAANVFIRGSNYRLAYLMYESSAVKYNEVDLGSAGGGGGRTTKNTRAFPLGMEIGMNWRSAA